MKLKFKFYSLLVKIIFSLLFLLFISLFFSAKKILIIFLISVLFFFLKLKFQKIVLINLFIFIILFKSILYPFQKKIPRIDYNKTIIYEKNFLYGVKNLSFNSEIYNGDLSAANEKYKKKYYYTHPKKIKIKTDKFGFRNETKVMESDYILIGDSFIQSLNITQDKILNNLLFRDYGIKSYNAGLGATDIYHYLETIKFFKKKTNLKNKKFIMFVFQGNDFLNYNLDAIRNYHKYIDNFYLSSYFKIKLYFNFYNSIKYFSNLKKEGLKKIKEYKIGKKDVLFYYIFKPNSKIPSFKNLVNKYKPYLPDKVIFIPTKYEVYCGLINENKCNKTNHFDILEDSFASTSVEILDTRNKFKESVKHYLNENDQLLFEIDDTHLNEIGIKVLAEFVSENLK